MSVIDLDKEINETGEDQVTEAEPTSFRCANCGREFDTKQGLTMHKTRMHNVRSKRKKAVRISKKAAVARMQAKNATLDYDKVLAIVAKDGFVPTHLMRRVSEWLAEGDNLVRLIAMGNIKQR